MRASFIALTSIIFLSLTVTSSTALAKTCSSRETVACLESSDSSSNLVDACVSNSIASSYFANSKEATVGDCSNFSLKRIKSYACNAGLRFVRPVNDICIKLDEGNAISSTCGDSLNCVCSSDSNSNEQKTNYFNFEISTYSPNVTASFIKKTLNASSNSDYAVASAQSGADILKDNSALQFNFGSDFYGAEYFVDLCVSNKNKNPSRFDLNLVGKIIFTNSIFNSFNYNLASSLYNKIDLSCTDGGAQTTKSLVSESPFLTAERSYNRNVSGSRNCVIRHYLRENAKNKIRENNFKKVSFQTDLKITPADSSLLEPLSVTYCNIRQDSKNKYSCTQFSVKGEDGIANNILMGATTYTGTCPKKCKPF